MITGKAACSEGEVTVLGQPARDNPELYRSIGVMSEHEAVYSFLTGRQFIEFTAVMQGLSPAAGPVDRAIALVGMEDAQDRKLGTYSRGMRQRIRLAAALVHDPPSAGLRRTAERHRPPPTLGFPRCDGPIRGTRADHPNILSHP